MRTIFWWVACSFAGGLAGMPAHARSGAPPEPPAVSAPATAPNAVSLRVALDAAWQRAIAARQTQARRAEAEAERATAERLWAAPPSLALDQRNDRWQSDTGARELELGIAVPLWLPGQRAAHAAVAGATAEGAEAAGQAERWRLAGEVREAAWQRAASEVDVASAEAQAAALARLAADVERRVGAGDLARTDLLAARAEGLAAQGRLADARQAQQRATTRWALLTGMPHAPDVTAADAARVEVSHPATIDAHPELALARQGTALARQRAALLRHSRRDAPELSIGVRHDVPGRGEPAQRSMAIGLRLPLATAERNAPREAAAAGALEVARAEEERLHERLQAELVLARDAAAMALRQRDDSTMRASLLREHATLTEAAFRAGESPLADLLRALATATQAAHDAARAELALGLARARLHHAHGLLP